ncbi:MAG: sulfurtransferase TusA family protein [Candidatus Marinimicrobia bacterium]|nr:sulfurtransferase TusA family protein [Candidatus Neomarinimicrobiota bacterium]
MNTNAFDQELDCKGLNCPLPILKTKKQIDKMETGQILKMVATDVGSINDMKAWSKRTENELLSHFEEAGTFTFFIRKT